jgi:hypothetical protein
LVVTDRKDGKTAGLAADDALPAVLGVLLGQPGGDPQTRQ